MSELMETVERLIRRTEEAAEAMQEAAAEIERLRADRDRWKNEAKWYHSLADRCDTGCTCIEDIEQQAVRGE